MITTRDILGVHVTAQTSSKLAEELIDRVAAGDTVRIAFANANLLNISSTSDSLRRILRNFLVLNDGSGVNLASRILGYGSFPENLNGTDFLPFLLGYANRPLRIYLFGASEEVVIRTGVVFRARWPQHEVVGLRNGYFQPEEEQSIRDEIVQSRPDVVLVALGNGKQENFAATLDVSSAAIFCVGALFDFLSGRVRRAPIWMRKLGIEWVYRLLVEPSRLWRRYVLGNPLFLLRVSFQRLRSHPHRRSLRGGAL